MVASENPMEWGVEHARASRNLALSTKLANFGPDLLCFAPSILPYTVNQFDPSNPNEFVAFSITGTQCHLHCEHCNAKVLSSLHPIVSPEQLYGAVQELVQKTGCRGILVSGGANADGEVPLAGYPGVMRRLKEDFNVACVVHSGLLQEDVACELARAKVDAVMLDIIGDDQVIHDICHLNRKTTDYEESLRMLEDRGIRTVPHIVVGLNYGHVKGEIPAIEIVARHKPAALVIVVLMPLEGTLMASVAPPELRVVKRIITMARLRLPKTPLLLGCARPGGKYKQKLDIAAIRSGINGIAYPCQEAVEYAAKHDFHPIFAETCCSLAYQYCTPPLRGDPHE